ncbi:Chitotriosidase-1 [Colletotrichum siamense]|uniref:chitinase n=1 Tax=Colletotrichum siamense TaxID=690259 RepID=A0A9P5BU29_COLSI|nr:Chitotriosidase-1 [Colletotrichum siamense]KAF4850016.1 Chitotriosidase-1 [Colletotrichum siamense]
MESAALAQTFAATTVTLSVTPKLSVGNMPKYLSNCVLDPEVPSGGSSKKVLDNKVIGYYEAWSARRSCRAFPPSGIPIDGLTHVNFAFAYIDPDTLQVTTMDSATPESLFVQTTAIKDLKSLSSELEVWVSIGGWTFSDNDTSTQAVFPDIAGDADKRQKFADNLVSFMTRYGFDGVDLDWEYPGAGDRGGSEVDTDNYVLLLKTLRETFQASPRGDYGLSFTIPSSYWYLKWFDVPSMLKYADWTNIMTYDLHGVWDANNPIGNIVQAHTNLTEIKLAADLLWRNDVPPGQVVLGLGFYGRSFQLKDTDCTKPGCAFSGPAKAGDCTNSAGTLAYFEIMDIIADQDPKFVYDKAAAANYIVYGDDKDMWVSYDDNTTFAQKVDWANEVGLGGVMIWSVDQDDTSFSALEGLLGESLPSFSLNLERASVAKTAEWASVNGQACKVSDCVSQYEVAPSGWATAPNGKFRDTCGSDIHGYMYKHVYCPTNAMPQSCTWRGSGSCHGQCHAGETTITHSSRGSQYCLAPGKQAFCCESNTWASYVDGCAWADGCGDCPADSPYEVSSRSIYKAVFSSCKQKFCCPYDFQNCHWVGKGTCDDNECSSTDVEVALDPSGDTGSLCAGGLSSRQKPLCCNTPNNVNPFLPVDLEDLFPTLPPTGDVPVFELQPLSYTAGDVADNDDAMVAAFLFVVIDGPSGTVSNLDKREGGSHLQFLTRGVHHGQEAQSTYFVCMDDSAKSNCDDMHMGGLEGTVLRMPDNMGFGKYAVAHAVRETTHNVPDKLIKRGAPANAKVMELEYSYDFSRVAKRDSGDIYFRVDYSDTHKYYEQVVEAAAAKRKRDDADGHPLESRFWSKLSSVWKTIIEGIRTTAYNENTQPAIKKSDFTSLIYGNDGSDNDCEDDGFLKISLSGSMSNKMRFGFTLVGTISPTLSVEEAYGYFDSDLLMSATLSFDGKGVLDINSGDGVARDMFSSAITNFEASQPGIVSFSPSLNCEVSLRGSGAIDAQFDVDFELASSETLRTNAPPGLGDFSGAVKDKRISNAATGYLSVPDDSAGSTKRATGGSFNSIFAMNMVLETTMMLKIFGYETSLENAGAKFTSRLVHAINIVDDVGTGSPGIIDAPQAASADVVQTGTIQSGWDDGTTHNIGSVASPAVVFTGGEEPPEREAPNINGYAVFGDKSFMGCSDNSTTAELICYYNFFVDNSTDDDDTDLKRRGFAGLDLTFKQEHLGDLSEREKAHFRRLDERAAGPSGGSTEDYPILDANANGGTADGFNFQFPTYPNGNNGDALDAETGRNERWSIANPNDCEDTSATSAGVQGVNYQTVESDHVDDRSIFPNHAAQFFQTGQLDMADNEPGLSTIYQSQNSLFSFANLFNYFAHDYRLWVPASVEADPPAGSAAEAVADAYGSSSNPDVMVNLARALNSLKGRMYTTEGQGVSDDNWNTWMNNPSLANAEDALSSIRAVFAMWNYMNGIAQYRTDLFDGRRDALAVFDNLYARTFPNRPERLVTLIDEFQPLWNQRAVNFSRRYVTARLDSMENTYRNLQGTHAALAANVISAITRMRARFQTEIVLAV